MSIYAFAGERGRKGGLWPGLSPSARCARPTGYKCQALLDETAVLSRMACVDLNPNRAGVCQAPERASHTAITRRIETLDARAAVQSLGPIAGVESHAS